MVDLDLTKRQKEIFDFIGKYAAKTGYPPTVREIGKAVGLHSSSTVHAHLANLEKIGLLRRDPSKPRAIELLFDKAKRTIRPGSGLPLVGQVAAGEPILAEENIEEYLEIPDVIGGEDGDYILQVRGESMKNAGILEADYVIVRPSDDAVNGEIVVALIGEEATVKRFFREKDHIRLQPENEELEPILTTEARSHRPRRRRFQRLRPQTSPCGVLGRLNSVLFRLPASLPSDVWTRHRPAGLNQSFVSTLSRRASHITSGSSRSARRGKRSNIRSSGPRQRGMIRIGRGRSVSLPTSAATCSGVSR